MSSHKLNEIWEVINKNNTHPNISDIQSLQSWVNMIKEKIKNSYKKSESEIASDNDKLVDEVSEIKNDYGELNGGKIMSASGNFNDCLIHSFLTCVTDFGTYSLDTRNQIAYFFRRKILPTVLNTEIEKIVWVKLCGELEGFGTLSDEHVAALAHLFKISIITIVTAPTKIAREMTIYEPRPTSNDDLRDYIVIHGNRFHFSPVKYGDTYIIQKSKQKMEQLAKKINDESIQERHKSTQIIHEIYGAKWDDLVNLYKELPNVLEDDIEVKKATKKSILDVINNDISILGIQNRNLLDPLIEQLKSRLPDNNSNGSTSITRIMDDEDIQMSVEKIEKEYKQNQADASSAAHTLQSPGKQLNVTMNGFNITVSKEGEQGLPLGPFTIGKKKYFANKTPVVAGGTRKRRSKQKKTHKRIRGLKR